VAARVAVVVVPVTISTVRKSKGLAFPVPRPILLASLIESASNCAAANGIPSCRFTRSLFPLFFSSQVLRSETCGWTGIFFS
jgi:hypothetical protein